MPINPQDIVLFSPLGYGRGQTQGMRRSLSDQTSGHNEYALESKMDDAWDFVK